MAELKTKPNDGDVTAFLDSIERDTRREDAKTVCALMTDVTGLAPKMWGDKIVAFGSYDYRYESGREGTFYKLGLSPGKQHLSIHLMDGFERHTDLLTKLGPHRAGRSCLYITRLERVDESVLRQLIERAWTSKAMGEVD